MPKYGRIRKHIKFIATVTPSMITIILLSVFSKRITPNAAFYALLIGSLLTALTSFFPEMVEPIAHGISAEGGYKFMRAFFGIVVTLLLALSISIFTKQKKDITGLTIDDFQKAKEIYKGSKINESDSEPIFGRIQIKDVAGIVVSKQDLKTLNANIGDYVYLCDCRWWLGGLKSIHMYISDVHGENQNTFYVSENIISDGHLNINKNHSLELIM